MNPGGYAMKAIRRVSALLLCLLLAFSFPTAALAAGSGVYDIRLTTDGVKESVTLKAFDPEYDGNIHVSLRSLAVALKSTDKKFSLTKEKTENDGTCWYITTKKAQGAVEEYPTAVTSSLSLNRIFLDGKEKKYYTYAAGEDLFMNLTDIQLLFDMSFERVGERELALHPDVSFRPVLSELREAGWFSYCNSVLVGDADTERILFSNNRLRPVPVASLTKLMTYLLTAEAIERGDVSPDALVKVSARAATLSQSPSEGIIWLSEGLEVPMQELLEALLICSSNEAAVVLAEYLSGSVEAFVERMNERAAELGLTFTRYYNPNGLPTYSGGVLPCKVQNLMTAGELFRLSSYILEHFPEVTDIASEQLVALKVMDYNRYNSNHQLFNVEGVNGLKTGYTDGADSCVVVSLPVTAKGETHTVLVIVLGAETAAIRNRTAEMLLRYAQTYYMEHGF